MTTDYSPQEAAVSTGNSAVERLMAFEPVSPQRRSPLQSPRSPARRDKISRHVRLLEGQRRTAAAAASLQVVAHTHATFPMSSPNALVSATYTHWVFAGGSGGG